MPRHVLRRVLGGRQFNLNQSITIRCIRQDRDSGDTVELLLDRDTNPFNNNFVRTLRSVNVAESDTVILLPAMAGGEEGLSLGV